MTFSNTDRNAPKKIRIVIIQYLLFKISAFGNNFGLREMLELKMPSWRRLGIFSSSTGKFQLFFLDCVGKIEKLNKNLDRIATTVGNRPF